MIVRIAKHKTVPTIAVVTAGPELAAEMGRFAFARWQPQHKAFWVEEQHLDTMTRTLARDGHTVIDERHTGTEEKFTGPLPECRSCGAPASRKAALTLNGCTACGDVWHPVEYQAPGSVSTRVECPACGQRQPAGQGFCGNCRIAMPPWPPADVDTHVALAAKSSARRTVLQDPLPIGAAMDELGLPMSVDAEEESDREWYP